MEQRIIVRIENGEKEKIQRRIKQEYPRLRNVSELVREALKEFLDEGSCQAGM